MRRLLLTLALGALILAAIAQTAAAVPAGSTTLVDRPSGFGGLPFDGANFSISGKHAMSADGRFVVFTSLADSLLDTSADDVGVNIYRLDRLRGRVEQVNTTADGSQSSPLSFTSGESISADGRYVAFSTGATNLVSGAPEFGLYVKDMNTGKVELASRATGPDGRPADGGPTGVISGDGRHVVFATSGPLHADNADGAANQTDAYVRSLDTGTTHLVSVNATGAGGGFVGSEMDINFDGSAAAFITNARLTAGDTDGSSDAYVRLGIGTAGEKTCFVSFSTGQVPGGDAADEVALSGDGNELAWSKGDAVFAGAVIDAAMARAKRVDVARTGGATGEEAGDVTFEPVAAKAQPSKRLYFLTSGPLDPNDRNGEADAYSAPVAFLGDPARVDLATSGGARGPVDSVAGADNGGGGGYTSGAPHPPGAQTGRAPGVLRADGADPNNPHPPQPAPPTDHA